MSTDRVNPRGNRPGAMTMAMRAAASDARPKVLRVGVVSGARIVEERVLDGRHAVTVGSSEACTFTVASEGIPTRFELFTLEHGRYSLRFVDGMDGRLVTPDGVQTLEALRNSGRAQRAGEGFAIGLNEHSRGKVSFGDVTLLFQFVVQPPAQPRPQLPVAIRVRPMRQMDWAYNATLAGFLFLAFTALGYVEYGYDPEVQDNFTLASRLVTSVENPPDDSRVEPVQPAEGMATPASSTPATPSSTATNTPRTPSHTPRTTPRGEHPTGPSASEVASAMNAAHIASETALHALANSAEWTALATAADHAHGTAHDGMAAGGTMNVNTTTLLGANGVIPGGATAGLVRHGDTAGPIGDPNALGRPHVTHTGGPDIVTAAPAGPTAPTGFARPGAPRINGGEGELDAAAVARVIGSSLGGIRACYNLELRQNAALSGRLSVSFTIGGDGRIHGTPSTSGMPQAPALGQCVARRINGLVFPQPRGGSVSFTFPFGFDANNQGH